VGANGDDTPAGTDAGSAYVFVRSGISWSEQTHLFASDMAASDIFGYSVALDGDTALVGAYSDNTPAGTDAGSAYVFVRSGTTWSEQAHLFASDAASTDVFGVSVALDGDTALIGALWDDTSAGGNAGSAYIFHPYRSDSDLALSGTFNNPTPLEGDTVLLTLNAQNIGPVSASGVLVDVTLPDGLTYVSHSLSKGSYSPVSESWSVGTLGIGAGATLVITASVDMGTGGQTLMALAQILSSDLNNANNTASASLIPVALTPPFSSIFLNPGFETDSNSDGLPDSWTGSGLVLANDRRDCTIAYLDACSFKMTGTNKSKKFKQDFIITGGAGNTFDLSVYSMAVSASGIYRVTFIMIHTDGSKVKQTVNFNPGTHGWEEVTISLTSTKAYKKLSVQVEYKSSSGTVWFDAVSVTGP
jgi:uncharacterized repeat protein (TIGR01451 family)